MDEVQAQLLWDRGTLEVHCERAQQVREGVEAYLGRAVFAVDAELKVRVRLTRPAANAGNVVALVTQEDATGQSWGERVVTGDGSCESLDEPLTLVVALMVDRPASEASEPTSSIVTSPPRAPRPSATVVVEDQPPTEISTTPSLERARAAPGHVALLVSALGAMGATPAFGFGGGLALVWKPRGFVGLSLDASVVLPRSVSLESGSLRVSVQSLDLGICPLQGTDGAAWWSLCGGVALARIHVRSRDLLEAKATSQYLAMPGLRARAATVLAERWLVGGGVAAAVPLSADRYTYRDAGGEEHTAFELSSPIVTASAFVGALFR
jgi:hypothetical protein